MENYELIRASDLIRDGMALELYDLNGDLVAEIFYSDRTHEMSFSAFTDSLSLELVEWFIDQARIALPPIKER